MSKTLIIHVDEVSQLACDFIFQDRKQTLKSDIIEPSIRNWSKGKRGLWILAAHTALKRFYDNAADTESSTDLPLDSAPYIDSLFDTASRDIDRVRPDRNASEHWILGIFDKNPREIYLKAFQNDLRKLVSFTNVVTISIRWNRTDRKCTSEELKKLRDFWILGGSLYIREVFMTVHAITNSGRFSVRQDAIQGHLNTGCSVSVEIKSTFRTNFCILWIDSSNELFCLHPFPDPNLEIEPSVYVDSDKGMKLIIPQDDYLPITTGEGTELCIALWKETPFSRSNVNLILEEIRAAFRTPMHTRNMKAPMTSHHHLKITKPKKASTDQGEPATRLGKPRSLAAWEKSVVARLKGSADCIQFLHIPNTTKS